MTHITGPRRHVVDRLAAKVLRASLASGATMSETFEAIHEVQMKLVRAMLQPWEDECPTCPKETSPRAPAARTRADRARRRSQLRRMPRRRIAPRRPA